MIRPDRFSNLRFYSMKWSLRIAVFDQSNRRPTVGLCLRHFWSVARSRLAADRRATTARHLHTDSSVAPKRSNQKRCWRLRCPTWPGCCSGSEHLDSWWSATTSAKCSNSHRWCPTVCCECTSRKWISDGNWIQPEECTWQRSTPPWRRRKSRKTEVDVRFRMKGQRTKLQTYRERRKWPPHLRRKFVDWLVRRTYTEVRRSDWRRLREWKRIHHSVVRARVSEDIRWGKHFESREQSKENSWTVRRRRSRAAKRLNSQSLVRQPVMMAGNQIKDRQKDSWKPDIPTDDVDWKWFVGTWTESRAESKSIRTVARRQTANELDRRWPKERPDWCPPALDELEETCDLCDGCDWKNGRRSRWIRTEAWP